MEIYFLTDVKHLLSCNPTNPAYFNSSYRGDTAFFDLNWIQLDGGLIDLGSDGGEFIFDCEGPSHKHWLEPYQLASRPITNGEYIEFINDGGYKRPELWLSDGWAAVKKLNWQSPLYWENIDGTIIQDLLVTSAQQEHGIIQMKKVLLQA